MFLELENRMEDNFKAIQNREAEKSLAVLPTFMELVLDTVEKVLAKSTERSS